MFVWCGGGGSLCEVGVYQAGGLGGGGGGGGLTFPFSVIPKWGP